MKLLDELNVDNVCWESDYPHSDSSWPEAPERCAELFAGLDDGSLPRITHRNAMRHYQFDPFAVRPPERCTAAALRAEAPDVDPVTHGPAGPPTTATSPPGSGSRPVPGPDATRQAQAGGPGALATCARSWRAAGRSRISRVRLGACFPRSSGPTS